MRHYDRADFRHLNDGERYRDYDYLADDGWTELDERPRSGAVQRQEPRAQGFEGRGPRREPMRERTAPVLRRVFGLLFHPKQAMKRALRGLFRAKGPKSRTRDEQRIYEDVCERLTRQPDVDASDIEVTVELGVITLAGSVPSRAMKLLADDAVEDVLGVKDVKNRLRVKPA
jgi:hypothetical protein